MEQHLPADDIETGHWGRYGHLGQWVITVIELVRELRMERGNSPRYTARHGISMLFTLKNRGKDATLGSFLIGSGDQCAANHNVVTDHKAASPPD